MIVTVTANSALDRTLVVAGFRPGEVNRAQQVLTTVGGKGNNVARVVMALGEPVMALGIAGGYTGRAFLQAIEQEGLPHDFVWTDGELRLATHIVDPTAHTVTVINEMGPPTPPEVWRALADKTLAYAAKADIVTFSGSLPPGVSTDDWLALFRMLFDRGVRVFVDTSGSTFKTALRPGPHLLKGNAHEFAAGLGVRVASVDEAVAAAKLARAQGPRNAVVTLGAKGAVAVTEEGVFFASCPPVQALQDVGSGDALLAGLAVSLVRGQGWAEGLRLGVALGAANALCLGAGFFHQHDLEAILPQVRLEALTGP